MGIRLWRHLSKKDKTKTRKPIQYFCMMDIHRLFDTQEHVKKRTALRATINKLDLKTTFRLMYEIGGRPGYRVEPLKNVLLMLTFIDEMQKDTFFTTLREELDKPLCIGHTGPCGSACTCTVVYEPTGTYFR